MSTDGLLITMTFEERERLRAQLEAAHHQCVVLTGQEVYLRTALEDALRERDVARVTALMKFGDIAVEVLALQEALHQARTVRDRLAEALREIVDIWSDRTSPDGGTEDIAREALASLDAHQEKT